MQTKLLKLLILFSLVLILPLKISFAQVTFSEVMNDPLTFDTHNEFIEIYNLSNEIVDLTGWSISDSSSQDLLIDAGKGMLLNPKSYAVILDGSYFGNSTVYDDIIPDSVLIVKVDDASIGSGLSNSTAKRLSLISDGALTIDEYKYIIGYEPGHSNEKIDITAGNDTSNWGEALVLGGTPGTLNSITPLDSDIGFSENSVSWTPSSRITTSQNVSFQINVYNFAINSYTENFSLRLFIDSNRDSSFSAGDEVLYDAVSVTDIQPKGSAIIQVNHTFETGGIYSLVAELYDITDQNSLNNSTFFQIFILDNSTTLHISEIKFLTNDSEPEWLELYNSGDKPIALQNWAIADERDTSLIDASVFIQPGQYKIIAADEGLDILYNIEDSLILVLKDLPTLNNTGDIVYLIHPLGDWLEQVPYTVDWLKGEQQYNPSLERISFDQDAQLAENWGPAIAVNGATPGMSNSIAPYNLDIGFDENSVSWLPSSQITTSQIVRFQLKIYNFGLNSFTDNFSLRFYVDFDSDSSYSTSDDLLFDETSFVDILPDEFAIVEADYTFETGGIFNIIAELYNISEQNPVNNSVSQQIVVLDSSSTLHINEIKFLTNDNEPEWLELYNSGDHPIALKHWAIADERDTSLIDTFVFIQPGQYKIISADDGLDTLYNIEDSLILVLKDLPSFNNTEDIIYLVNPLGGWLEQVPYNVDWLEGEDWRNPSLERINVELEARQARNWGPSTAASAATPTEQNAIYAPFDTELKSRIEISPNPFSPDGDGEDDHTLISINLPTNSAKIKVEIYDIMGRKIRTLKDNAFSGSTTSLVWDGEDSSGRRARMGIYIVFVQILNDREGVLKEMKETVVVARQL